MQGHQLHHQGLVVQTQEVLADYHQPEMVEQIQWQQQPQLPLTTFQVCSASQSAFERHSHPGNYFDLRSSLRRTDTWSVVSGNSQPEISTSLRRKLRFGFKIGAQSINVKSMLVVMGAQILTLIMRRKREVPQKTDQLLFFLLLPVQQGSICLMETSTCHQLPLLQVVCTVILEVEHPQEAHIEHCQPNKKK